VRHEKLKVIAEECHRSSSPDAVSPETSSSTHRKNSVVEESLSTPEGLSTSVVALLKSPFSLETTGGQSDAWKYRGYEEKTPSKLTTAPWVRLMVQTGTRLGPVGRCQLEE
jgi:hypothetical protein